MKATVKTLMLILIIAQMLTLAACGDKTPGGGDLPENSLPSSSGPETEVPPTENKPLPESSSPPPVTQTPSQSPDVTIPAESVLPASIWPTFDEAKALCEAWLEAHPDLTAYAILEWDDTSDEAPPPTYSLFGEEYYEFFVSPLSDGEAWYKHIILVNAETGELLSLFGTEEDGAGMVETVEPLEDWYNEERTEYAQVRLTAEEAIGIYDAWRDEHSEISDYRLNTQSYDKYVMFGEQYYHFRAEEYYMYWYNILVHMETGELLFMMTSDGQYPLTSIEPLDDWYDGGYA